MNRNEIKKLLSLADLMDWNECDDSHQRDSQHRLVSQKVIIRTYSAGVHYGTLVKKDGGECVLKDAIRIWYWDGAASLSQLAVDGVQKSKEKNCKFAKRVPSIDLQWIEIIETTEKAQECIEGIEPWEN